MKRSLLLPAFLLLIGSLSAPAQTVQTHSFVLEVNPASTGGNVQTTRQSTGSSKKKSTTLTTMTNSKETLQINVRNFGHLPDSARVEWYFIAAPVTLEPGKSLVEQEYAFDQGSKDINLPGNGVEPITAESQEVTSTLKRSGKGRRGTGNKASGNKLSGWVVRVVSGGRVVAAKGSTQSLEDIAKDEAKLKDLVSE